MTYWTLTGIKWHVAQQQALRLVMAFATTLGSVVVESYAES